MIDHENDDRVKKKKILIGYSSTLSGTLSSDFFSLQQHAVQSIDVRRERSLALKSRSDVWVATYTSD